MFFHLINFYRKFKHYSLPIKIATCHEPHDLIEMKSIGKVSIPLLSSIITVHKRRQTRPVSSNPAKHARPILLQGAHLRRIKRPLARDKSAKNYNPSGGIHRQSAATECHFKKERTGKKKAALASRGKTKRNTA